MGTKNSKKTTKKGTYLRVVTMGISGSGKSTFSKQLKLLYCNGFTDEERIAYRDILFYNVLHGMKELVTEAAKLDCELRSDLRKTFRFFMELNPLTTEWNSALQENIEVLWADKAIQKTWTLSGAQLTQISNLKYLIENLDRYCSDGFIPNTEDILRARQRTTGFNSFNFEISKINWSIVDAGGQLCEQLKWQTILSGDETNVDEEITTEKSKGKQSKSKKRVNTAVVYFVALDEYDVASLDDPTKSKMEMSKAALENLDNETSFPLIIFLNKFDLFTSKIKSTKGFESFKTTFPDYTGKQNEIEAANHVLSCFKAGVDREKHDLSVHLTCALDTNAMDSVFKALTDTLLKSRLALSGLVL